MTPFEIIYGIREKLKEYVDDTRYTDEFLMYEIDITRSVLLRQQYDRVQRPVDDQIVQTFIVEVEEIDSSESPLTHTIDETIMRSKLPLPRVLELGHRNMLERVSTGGMKDRPLNIVSRKRFVYAGNNDFDIDQLFATMDGSRYLYIKSKNDEEFSYETVAVSAVLERPLEVLDFPSLSDDQTLDNFTYPISGTLALVLIDEVVNKLAKLKVLPSDQKNDSTDDSTILNNGQQQKR